MRAYRTSARMIAEQDAKVTDAAQLSGIKGIGKGSMALVLAHPHPSPLLGV